MGRSAVHYCLFFEEKKAAGGRKEARRHNLYIYFDNEGLLPPPLPYRKGRETFAVAKVANPFYPSTHLW
jgi:hypothetical protein